MLARQFEHKIDVERLGKARVGHRCRKTARRELLRGNQAFAEPGAEGQQRDRRRDAAHVNLMVHRAPLHLACRSAAGRPAAEGASFGLGRNAGELADRLGRVAGYVPAQAGVDLGQ